jgi:NADH-quinone oxidoreductase subunit J
MAGLLVLLETYLLAVLQVLVYAGAIIVLFLFIIMLIDAKTSPAPSKLRLLAASFAFLLLVFGVRALAFSSEAMAHPSRHIEAPAAAARSFGIELFTRYMLPFQVTGFMLLIAMVGVIVVTRRREPHTGGTAQ